MIRSRFTRAGVALAAVALGGVLALVPISASAEVPTTIVFETDGPVSTAFAETWSLTLTVSSSASGYGLIATADGTVDVYFSGIGGAFAAGLPIQPDGRVYVSQPTNQALLSAGEYEVSAIYNPAPGSYFDSSQTSAPLLFSVSALSVIPSVEVINDEAVSELPIITATLAGEYVDAFGGAPAGTWDFAVSDAHGEPVFDTQLAQLQGATETSRVEISTPLKKGGSYTLESTFTPVDELAGGLEVASVEQTTFTTPTGTIVETLLARVAMPLWSAILMLVLILGLVAATIVLGVRLRGRNPAAEAVTKPAPRIPGDPGEVHIMSLQDAGLPEPETVPDVFAEESPTVKLPESTTWLLSDVEPATSIPSASEAPTERLDAILATELPGRDSEPEAEAELDSDEPAAEVIDSTSNGDDADGEQSVEPTTKE